METLFASGKTVCIFPAAEPNTPVVYLNTLGQEGQQEFDSLAAAGGPVPTLVAVSVSGSLWFPGFREYVLFPPVHQPDCVYFSLGDKERKTRNSVLQTVQENTEASIIVSTTV